MLEVCRSRGVPLLINDRVDVALAVGADGVHIGQVRELQALLITLSMLVWRFQWEPMACTFSRRKP